MKNLKWVSVVVFVTLFYISFQSIRADGTNSVAAKPTPYPLDHCVVSGEKFGGDMGKPIEFIYKTNDINQEIKFCCPMCKPQFVKDPDKYMKEIKDAESKNAKK